MTYPRHCLRHRRRSLRALSAILLCAWLLASCAAPQQQPSTASSQPTPSRVTSQAPDLTLPSLNGRTYGLRAQAGHVLVLDFMSSWCQTCTEALPGVERMAKRWQGRGVRVWVVSIDEDRSDLEAVLKRVPVGLPVLLDSKEVWFKHFALSAVPTAVVLDRDGKVVATVNEPPGTERYEDAIEAVLKQMKPTK